MGFAMRMNFVDVVVSDSLKHYYVDGKKMGYQFDVRDDRCNHCGDSSISKSDSKSENDFW